MHLRRKEFNELMRRRGLSLNDIKKNRYHIYSAVTSGEFKLETAKVIADMLNCRVIDIATDHYLQQIEIKKKCGTRRMERYERESIYTIK